MTTRVTKMSKRRQKIATVRFLDSEMRKETLKLLRFSNSCAASKYGRRIKIK